jgi:hypothetical protein
MLEFVVSPMRTAVNFNHKPRHWTGEIGNVRAYWMLTAKTMKGPRKRADS